MAHLVPKEIVELPFVDRAPNPSERPDQRRIEWIRNGDCLGAAEHAADNGGELNRGPVQVQKNATTLMDNEKIIQSSLSEIIERVNSHDDALGDIGDDNLATKVQELEDTIAPMDATIKANSLGIFLTREMATKTKESLGTKEDEDINDRTAYEDLLWVKEEIGNWAGRDVNDNHDDTKPDPSGLKARLVSHGLGISSNERRIVKLENDWVQSDVGALTSEVQDIRLELGLVVDAPQTSVYKWVKKADIKHVAIDAEIQSLKDIVGGQGGQTLDERINQNTSNIANNTLDLNQANNKIDILTATVGTAANPQTVMGKLTKAEIDVMALKRVVGESEDQGMQKTVQDIANEIGSDGVANSIKSRITVNEGNILNAQRDIATVVTQIGSAVAGSETGIYRRLATTEAAISSPGDGINAKITALETSVATKVSDAPNDGKLYGRQSQSWVEVSGAGGGIGEAPTDGDDYVRVNSGWSKLNRNGVVVPEGKALEGMDGAAKFTLMQKVAGNINIGDALYNLNFRGKVGGFKTTRNFLVVSEDNQEYLKLTGSLIEFGDDSMNLVLKSSSANPLSVKMGGTTYPILHEGNYPDAPDTSPNVRVKGTWEPLADFMPLRIYGGYSVAGNTSATVLSATPTAIVLDSSKVTALSGTTIDVSETNGKLVFTDRAIGRVVNTVLEMDVSVSTATAVKFDVTNKAGTVVFSRTIETDEWSSGKKAQLRIQVPVQLVAADEVIIKASAATGTPSVTIASGVTYAHSI